MITDFPLFHHLIDQTVNIIFCTYIDVLRVGSSRIKISGSVNIHFPRRAFLLVTTRQVAIRCSLEGVFSFLFLFIICSASCTSRSVIIPLSQTLFRRARVVLKRMDPHQDQSVCLTVLSYICKTMLDGCTRIFQIYFFTLLCTILQIALSSSTEDGHCQLCTACTLQS